MSEEIKYSGKITSTKTDVEKDIVEFIQMDVKHGLLGHTFKLKIEDKNFLTDAFRTANTGRTSPASGKYPSMGKWDIEIIFKPKLH